MHLPKQGENHGPIHLDPLSENLCYLIISIYDSGRVTPVYESAMLQL
jgi:hypothetical protein